MKILGKKARQKVKLLGPPDRLREIYATIKSRVFDPNSKVIFEDKVYIDYETTVFRSKVVIRWHKKNKIVDDIWAYDDYQNI